MKYKKTQLANGLRVITAPMPSLESVTLTVWVGTGSRSETDREAGISHFLEHMAFKGGKKYKNAKAVSEAVDAIGGEFNAATSKDWTNFYIKAHKKHLEKAFDVLSDMLLTPRLARNDIRREKGVIVEEINMYEDTPMYKIEDIFEQTVFDGLNLGRDVIGTKETVTSFKRDDFVSYRETFYKPDNMLITVAGATESEEVIELAKRYFEGLRGSLSKKPELYTPKQSKPKLRLKNKKVDQVHLMLGFLGHKMDHKDRYVESVLGVILGGGMSSRLFTEVREKRGLAYSISAGSEHFVDTGYLACHAGLDPARIDEAIKVILGEFYKLISVKSSLISDNELTKSREYIKGHLALGLENTKAVNAFLGVEEIILGKTRTPDEIYEGIDKVTKEDIVRLASELFRPEKLSLAVIGPFKGEGRFERLIKS